jgi:cellulose synthase (UDP-forming)
MRKKYHNDIPYIPLEWPRVLVAVLAWVAIMRYMIWRVGTFNPEHPIFSWILYGAELFGLISMMKFHFMIWRLSDREAPSAEPGHTVDVFIPTINEPVSVVRRTALTAMAMDYPHQTWILDDGRRDEIRALAAELGCGYIARPNNEHAKAGNLNYALARTGGEFIAIFDADHAPKKTFLLRTIGYFRDAKIAFVQTPQDFYNLDSYQHRAAIRKGRLWSEQSLFFHVIQRGKDMWNAAFFCGSCAIVRRSALTAIGGFATGTVTEDIHTSIRLHKAGFTSAYHCESLAYGIAAAQIEPFLKQRIRWGQGAMQVWRKERIVFSRQLSVPQKICYMASILTYFDGWQKCLYYFTPAFVLMTGWAPIVTDTREFLIYFVPYFLMCIWAAEEMGRGYCRPTKIEQYNMARFWAFCWATVGLFRKNLKFNVTNKRMVSIPTYSLYMLPHYFIFLINAIAIPLGILFYSGFHHLDQFALSANIVWAGVNLIIAGMVMMFTLSRIGYQRHDYRFAIPLVAALSGPDGRPRYGAVDDLSSAGMLLLLPENPGFAVDQEIRGELHLPGEVIPFHALIRTFGARHNSNAAFTAGCQFLWEDHAARNRLELFLYGSNLEWQVHHISERIPTILERALPGVVFWHELDTLPAYANGYDQRHSMIYTPAGAQAIEPGIVATEEGSERSLAMVFTPFSTGAVIDSQVFTATGWKPLRGRVKTENKIEYLNKPMYFYELERLN